MRPIAGALVVIAFLTIGIVAMPERVGEVIAPPATFVPTSDVSPNGSAAQLYIDDLNPYLSVVIGEGKRLAELGQSRSRNLLELGVRMDRFRKASMELQTYIDTHVPPAELEPKVTDLITQLAHAEEAIQASIEAIRAFDWIALGESVDEFSRAVETMESLSGQINE